VHGRTGSSNAFVAPAGVFRSGDGEWVTFTAATQSVFARFCALEAPPSMTGAVLDINGASYVR